MVCPYAPRLEGYAPNAPWLVEWPAMAIRLDKPCTRASRFLKGVSGSRAECSFLSASEMSVNFVVTDLPLGFFHSTPSGTRCRGLNPLLWVTITTRRGDRFSSAACALI